MQLRSHSIAQQAYSRVAARSHATPEQQKRYGALVHKLPAFILQNGLAHTTGFLLAKAGGKQRANEPVPEERTNQHNEQNSEHRQVLDDLRECFNQLNNSKHDNWQFHQHILKADLSETMALTRRALEMSTALRRYVQGVLGIGSTGNKEQATDASESEGQ